MRARSLSALCLLMVACGPESAPQASTPAVRDSAGIGIVANGPLTDLPRCALEGPTVTIGGQLGEPGHDLHRVFGAARLGDGRIALANTGTDELRFYDASGAFLHSAGRSGNGPGEFTNAWRLFRLPGDTLLVGDYLPWHYEVFGPQGAWVRDIRPSPSVLNPPGGGGVLDDGSLILAQSDFGGSDDFSPGTGRVIWYRSDATLGDTLIELETARQGTTTNENFYITTWFASNPVVDASGSRVLLGRTDEPRFRLFRVGDDVTLSTIVRWEDEDRTVTPEVLEAARERERARREAEGSSTELIEMFLSDDRPAEDRYPAYASARFGIDGAIWLNQYDLAEVGGSSAWVRFDADGVAQCTLTLPDGSAVQEFGSDYVLLKRRNELDVERIELHRWTRPAGVG